MSRLSSQLLYEKGLIDPVSTGYDGNAAFSPTSRNITVVRARNGYRAWFKGVDHTRHPGATTVEVMGNHCNIGGGHDHGIAARVLEASTAWFRTSGVPIGEVRPHSRYDGQATIYHERDIPCADDVSRASRSPVARAVSPWGSALAGAAAWALCATCRTTGTARSAVCCAARRLRAAGRRGVRRWTSA